MGHIGVPTTRGPPCPQTAELTLVDDPVVSGGSGVPLESRRNVLVRDDRRSILAALVGLVVERTEAEDVVKVAVGVDGGMHGLDEALSNCGVLVMCGRPLAGIEQHGAIVGVDQVDVAEGQPHPYPVRIINNV